MKKAFYFIVCMFIYIHAFAQDTTGSDNTGVNALRADGKIYVVMAVVITILIGLILYIIRLDRKLTKLERKDPGNR